MDDYFSLFLKIFVSVIILYIAFNATFRYHSVLRLTLLGAVLCATIGSYFFIGTTHYLAYGIMMGAIAVVGVGSRLFLAARGYDIFFLISFIDKDQRPQEAELRQFLLDVGGVPENLGLLLDRQYLIVIRHENFKTIRKFQKKVEEYLQKRTRRFGLIQYFHIIIALTLIASIWRF